MKFNVARNRNHQMIRDVYNKPAADPQPKVKLLEIPHCKKGKKKVSQDYGSRIFHFH